MTPLENNRSREILYFAVTDNYGVVPLDSDLYEHANAWIDNKEYYSIRAEYDRCLFRILDTHFQNRSANIANIKDLFKIPDTSSTMADINMVYVTPINCRLIQPTDGSLAYVIQQDAMTQEWSRYDPSARSWIRDNSVGQLPVNPMDVQIPAAALTTTVKYVQTLFDSGTSHTMVSNAKYFVPHTMITLNRSFARTALGQRMPVVVVGQIRQCKLAMYIPALTKNLVAPSHICRDGAWPGQFRQCKLAMYIPPLTKSLVAPSHICRDGA